MSFQSTYRTQYTAQFPHRLIGDSRRVQCASTEACVQRRIVKKNRIQRRLFHIESELKYFGKLKRKECWRIWHSHDIQMANLTKGSKAFSIYQICKLITEQRGGNRKILRYSGREFVAS